ncbi:MAG: 50S ribosomal protein L25 [Acidobacteria bacterium]|jgi:large subunit ribosomal protein L25|nr:50S ribosomal protein L25 [Acidobacteriota bacterium]
MSEFVVAAESRTESGKSSNRRLRSRGLIPGVVYGAGKETVPVAVSPSAITDILRSASGENTLFDLEVEGGRRKVILKEFQREPLKGELLHADFFEVALDKPIEVGVHIELLGTPTGVKNQGGILDFITRELEVECLPADIPDSISLDVSGLELGKHLRVSDVQAPSDKVTILTDPEVVIVHVVTPRAEVAAAEEEAAEEEAAEAGAEPEVGKKGKAEEGEAGEKAEKKEK